MRWTFRGLDSQFTALKVGCLATDVWCKHKTTWLFTRWILDMACAEMFSKRKLACLVVCQKNTRLWLLINYDIKSKSAWSNILPDECCMWFLMRYDLWKQVDMFEISLLMKHDLNKRMACIKWLLMRCAPTSPVNGLNESGDLSLTWSSSITYTFEVRGVVTSSELRTSHTSLAWLRISYFVQKLNHKFYEILIERKTTTKLRRTTACCCQMAHL